MTIGKEAWSLDFVRERGTIKTDSGMIITWEAGQNSALGDSNISEGKDVGNVVVQRATDDGLLDVAYSVDFASPSAPSIQIRRFTPNSTGRCAAALAFAGRPRGEFHWIVLAPMGSNNHHLRCWRNPVR